MTCNKKYAEYTQKPKNLNKKLMKKYKQKIQAKNLEKFMKIYKTAMHNTACVLPYVLVHMAFLLFCLAFSKNTAIRIQQNLTENRGAAVP